MPPSDGAPGGTGTARLSALYQELILDHYRRPRNRGTVVPADATGVVKNPLCGDELTVTLALDGDRVREARFEGRGCSISLSTASIMTQLVAGRTAAEVEALRRRFAAMLAGDPAAAADAALGELRALAGVARFPARHRCALLPWQALADALAQRAHPQGHR